MQLLLLITIVGSFEPESLIEMVRKRNNVFKTMILEQLRNFPKSPTVIYCKIRKSSKALKISTIYTIFQTFNKTIMVCLDFTRLRIEREIDL